MDQTASTGSNRTGIATAGERTREMLSGVEEFLPDTPRLSGDVARVRIEYASEAEPIGSVPSPAGLKGTTQTAVKAATGGQPTLFLDKLGERLAFERSGTRLYEALVSKFDAYGAFTGGPSREDLAHVGQEEYEHFMLLQEAVERLGGDPTAVTPSANVQATASRGIEDIVVDPRTTLLQSLEVVLVAELTDNACWEALVELARIAGEDELAGRFEEAHATEQEHLAKVERWVAAGQGRSADRTRRAA